MRARIAVVVLLVASGCVGPGCMRAEDCKTMCGERGAHYFGPVRGGGTAECICNDAPGPERSKP